MNKYECLHRQQFDDGPYRLVPLRHQDIQSIKDWRNAQIAVLRQAEPLSATAQEKYYRDVVTPAFHEKQPRQILLSYLLNGQCIGYGGLVRIDWTSKQAEVSFLVDPQRSEDKKTYQTDFSHFLRLIKDAAFNDLRFKRLYTETYDIRPLHISILESQGFILEERLTGHVTKGGKTMDSLIHGCLSHV